MTGAELLVDLKGKLGNTDLGLTDPQLYRNLNEAKKQLERTTYIGYKGDAGVICDAGAGTIKLSAATIDIDTDFSLITIIDDNVIFDSNWDGRGVPPFVEKTSTAHIRLLRNTNDRTGDPQLYAIHRVVTAGVTALTLELYPAVSGAQADFLTSNLRCDIKQMSPEISLSTSADDLLIPDYSEQAVSYKAAMNTQMALKVQRWVDMKIALEIEMRTVRKYSNEHSTGGVRQRLAQ